MSMDYSTIAVSSRALIVENGRTMYIRTRVLSGTTYDPTVTPTDTPITGVASKYRHYEIDGELVQKKDIKVLCLPSSIVPGQEDQLVDGSSVYSILDVNEVKPGDTTLLYILQVRK